MKWISASSVMSANECPAFTKVAGIGIDFEYQFDPHTRSIRDILIRAMHAGNVVAEANFTDDNGSHPPSLIPQNVRVEAGFQRKGIATAIYVLAEKIIGKPLTGFWDEGEQTPDSRGLWAQPGRPFGNPPGRSGG